MKGLQRISGSRYANDRGQSQRSAKQYIEVMLQNSRAFNLIKKKGIGMSGTELFRKVLELDQIAISQLTDKQLSFISDIYDKFSNAYLQLMENEKKYINQ